MLRFYLHRIILGNFSDFWFFEKKEKNMEFFEKNEKFSKKPFWCISGSIPVDFLVWTFTDHKAIIKSLPKIFQIFCSLSRSLDNWVNVNSLFVKQVMQCCFFNLGGNFGSFLVDFLVWTFANLKAFIKRFPKHFSDFL